MELYYYPEPSRCLRKRAMYEGCRLVQESDRGSQEGTAKIQDGLLSTPSFQKGLDTTFWRCFDVKGWSEQVLLVVTYDTFRISD